jgi:hypothetical protein
MLSHSQKTKFQFNLGKFTVIKQKYKLALKMIEIASIQLIRNKVSMSIDVLHLVMKKTKAEFPY